MGSTFNTHVFSTGFEYRGPHDETLTHAEFSKLIETENAPQWITKVGGKFVVTTWLGFLPDYVWITSVFVSENAMALGNPERETASKTRSSAVSRHQLVVRTIEERRPILTTNVPDEDYDLVFERDTWMRLLGMGVSINHSPVRF